MAANHILNTFDDCDRSPVCKRARYDIDSDDSGRWTLSKNELILHSVYDSGVGRLGGDSKFDLKLDSKHRKSTVKIEPSHVKESSSSKLEQITILQASLPENTLQKLSLGELETVQLINENLEESSKSINYFDFLSDEVILQVLKNLTKEQLGIVALVCKRFSQLIEDESLWTHMDVVNRILEPGAIGKILSRQVIILRLARSRINEPSILPNCKAALPDFNSRLMYLDLTMVEASPKSLSTMLDKCKRLKKISLESVPISDSVLTALSGNRDLEVINLAMCQSISLEGIKAVLTNCRQIKELNMSWTYLSADSINFICNNLPSSIDRFNFSGCRKLLQDHHVAKIVTSCPYLRELDLSDCTAITGEAIRKLTVLEELNFLSLSRCYLVPFRSLLYLKKMRSLTYLDVHGSYINSDEFKTVLDDLGPSVNINRFKFSSIARPTLGNALSRKSTIWNMRVHD